jgi:hypothetical protein
MDIDTSAKEDVPLADFVEDFPKHFLIKAERGLMGVSPVSTAGSYKTGVFRRVLDRVTCGGRQRS